MLELFKKCPYIETLSYGFGKDLFDGFFVKEICEALNEIETSISELNKEVNDVDTLYGFLWSQLFIKFANNLNILNIDESKKEKISAISKLLKPDHKSFIEYINDKIDVLIKEDQFDETGIVALEYAFKNYSAGLTDNTINVTINKYYLYVLSRYEKFEKYFKRNKGKIVLLFANLKDTKLFDDQIYVDFFKTNFCLVSNDENLLTLVNWICQRSYDFFAAQDRTGNNKNYYQLVSYFKIYYELSNAYHLPIFNKYNELKLEFNEGFDNFIKTFGEKVKYGPINLKETVIDKITKVGVKYRFLILTHGLHADGTYKNTFDRILKLKQPNSMSELFEDFERPKNRRFPLYKQNHIIFDLQQYSAAIACIYNDDELRQQLIDNIYTITMHLNEILDHKFDIVDESTGIFQAVADYIQLAKNKEETTPFGRFELRSIALSSVVLIEKIIRFVAYNEVKDDRYFDIKSETLYSIFKNCKLAMLSESLKYYLEYYLLCDTKTNDIRNRPGLNTRNEIVHNYDNSFNKMSYATAMELVYLLLNLLNDIYLHYAYKKK